MERKRERWEWEGENSFYYIKEGVIKCRTILQEKDSAQALEHHYFPATTIFLVLRHFASLRAFSFQGLANETEAKKVFAF